MIEAVRREANRMKDLLITLLNTAFWFGLHFGTAGAV